MPGGRRPERVRHGRRVRAVLAARQTNEGSLSDQACPNLCQGRATSGALTDKNRIVVESKHPFILWTMPDPASSPPARQLQLRERYRAYMRAFNPTAPARD